MPYTFRKDKSPGLKNKTTGILLVLFAIALLAELSAIYLNHGTLRYFTKPVLMPLLAAWYLAEQHQSGRRRSSAIPAALFFSWLGDLFLLFDNRMPLFFVFGLLSFLTAHIIYLFYFNRLRVNPDRFFRFLWLLPVAVYYFFFMELLGTGPGDLLWPVRIYGITICLMLFTAVRLPRGHRDTGGLKMLAGALLFVVSDSLLAIDKFHRHFEPAAGLIMLTYGMAQLLIVTGAAQKHLNLPIQKSL